MLAVAYINCTRGFAAKFMVMAICKISAEGNLMIVVIAVWNRDGLAGYSDKAVVMAIIAFAGYFGAAKDFMDVALLSAAAGLLAHIKVSLLYSIFIG